MKSNRHTLTLIIHSVFILETTGTLFLGDRDLLRQTHSRDFSNVGDSDAVNISLGRIASLMSK